MNLIKRILFTGFMFAVFAIGITAPEPVMAQTYQQHIDKYCRKDCVDAETLVNVAARAGERFGFNYKAFLAIIHTESKYHIKAKNGSSVGLTQVLLRYHRPKFMGKNFFAVEDNVFAGAEVFGDCVRKHKGNYPTAYSCYNGYGQGDSKYRSKVMKAWDEIKRLELPLPSMDPLGDFIMAKLA